jgi:hypothetical protein
MKIFLIALSLLTAASALADTVGSPRPEEATRKDENEIQRTYEGNIRGIRALMADLESEQPKIHQKLKLDFDSLDSRQSKADTIAYVAYGTSIGFAAYGISKWFGLFKSADNADGSSSGASFTPFLISLGVSLVGGWAYYITRPSPQEYLDFTNKHNRLNKSRQLQWNISFDLRKDGAGAGVAYYF